METLLIRQAEKNSVNMLPKKEILYKNILENKMD